jgi:histidinol-phosphatase (PHP family)
MRTDVHAHTTFSDGSELASMVEAAESAGLDALGLTDHCIVTEDPFGRHERYDLAETYERRREAIEDARTETDLRLYDAAEMSYVAGAEAAIESFLSTAGFEYTIGSVHFADDYNFTKDTQYVDADDETRRAAVERYYDWVVDAVESELFDVLGHLDLPERQPTLRGYSHPKEYERVAAALADSRTVPELNAGRVHRSLGRPHPNPEMLQRFAEHGVEFVLGTDSHRPAELPRRVPELEAAVEESALELVALDSLLD